MAGEAAHKASSGSATASEDGWLAATTTAINSEKAGVQARYSSTTDWWLEFNSASAAVSHSRSFLWVMVMRPMLRRTASIVTRLWWQRKVRRKSKWAWALRKSGQKFFQKARVKSAPRARRSAGTNWKNVGNATIARAASVQ